MKHIKRMAIALTVLLVLLGFAGCYLLGGDPVPEQSDYRIDVDALRALARSQPGALPVSIDSELVAAYPMPRAVMMAGEGFEPQTMVHPFFRVRYPDGRFVMIDTGMNAETAATMGGEGSFIQSGFDALITAMSDAWKIVITHEHADHIGGVGAHPNPLQLADSLVLSRAQAESAYWLDEAAFPPALLERIEPLDYQGAAAVAPGVVLKAARGHTPGSQMVFVSLADGRDFLFVGDVAWCREAIIELKYRPRITTMLLSEERERVLAQFRALHELVAQGEVTMVVSHEPGDRAAAGIPTALR